MNRPVPEHEAQRQLLDILKEAQHYAHLHGLNVYCTMVDPNNPQGMLLISRAHPWFVADAVAYTLSQHPHKHSIMERLDSLGLLEPEAGDRPARSQQPHDQAAGQAAGPVDLPGLQPGRLSLTDQVLLALPDILHFTGLATICGLSLLGLVTLLRA